MKALITRASLLALLAGTGAAMGQSVNIDLNRSSGLAPSNAFAGAAGQAGFWNTVTTGSGAAVNLNGLNGLASGLTMSRNGNGGSTVNVAGASTDFNRLMADYDAIFFSVGSSIDYTVNGLDPGLYRVYAYAALNGTDGWYTDGFGIQTYYTNQLELELNGVSQGFRSTSGPVTPNVFQPGVTHGIWNVVVGAGAPTMKFLSSTGFTSNEASALSGMQIVKVTATRLYVNDNATGANTGQDWANAMTSLQDALDLATKSNGQITEIWVATGTYKPGNSRSASFVIPSGLKMYGGFAGTESSISERPDLTLGGGSSLNGSGANAASNTDNNYHVVEVSNTSSSTRLDGFVIAYGFADGSGDDVRGGGIFGMNADLTIANVGIRYCEASSEGGGIYLGGNSSAKLVNCHLARNIAGQFGGGLRNTSTVSIGMVNTTFMENEAGINGGAINSTGSFLIVHNSVFKGNTAANGGSGQGGAVYVFGSTADSLFRNCTFSFNRTVGGASGVYGGVGLGSNAKTTVHNSIFWSNLDGSSTTSKLAEQVGGTTGTTVAVSDSILEGATILFGTRNLGVNPLFVDQFGPNNIAGDWDDNLSLQPGSPAIDSGNNASMPSDQFDANFDGITAGNLPIDILGNLRQTDDPSTANTGLGSSPIVDRGAIEFQPPAPCPCVADFDASGGTPDASDIDAFFNAWLAGSDTADADCSGGTPDSSDIDAFFTQWLAGGC
jgi:predicted outer membrane repeat protein